jgi:hypothetical protein
MKKLLLGAAFAALLTTAVNATPAPVPLKGSTAQINITSSTTKDVAPNVAGKSTYVSSMSMMASATDVVSVEYGTKVTTDCDTGATVIAGPYTMAANSIVILSMLYVPQGKDVCIVTSTGATLGGHISSSTL